MIPNREAPRLRTSTGGRSELEFRDSPTEMDSRPRFREDMLARE